MIPKKRLIPLLQKEAPDFLAEILNIEIPDSSSRLNVPVVTTQEKQALQKINQSPLEMFIDEKCTPLDGQMIKTSLFYDRFIRWLDPSEMERWSKIRVGKTMPPQYPKGRRRSDGHHYIGNLWWKDEPPATNETKRLVLKKQYLEPDD
jgi:hypothetical protein